VLKDSLKIKKRDKIWYLIPNKNKNIVSIMHSFSEIVKSILKQLPKSDYPVLDSRKFFKIWLTFVLDRSLMSMRDLFFKLKHTGIGDISNL
jgi:hypothetical protein